MAVEQAEVRYAKRENRHVAYQVRGDGPIDLLGLSTGTNVWVDRDDEPHWGRFDRRLASFSRLIRFDPAGFGLSDPPADGSGPTLDGWVQDAIAVLDDVGSPRAALFGVNAGAGMAIALSATHPERVTAQVLMHGTARISRDVDYPIGYSERVLENFVEAINDPRYQGDAVDDLSLMAPSLAGDAEFRLWWKRAGERSASPAVARAMNLLSLTIDQRASLPTISTTTLVLHRVDNTFIPISHGRYIAEHIRGAEFVELPGRDHLAFAGETDELLDIVEEFLTGTRGTLSTDRVLATVLFTDIVDSTTRAAGTGDRAWRDVLDRHDRMAEQQIRRFGGRPVKSTGDGVLATFESPARSIQCARAICEGAQSLGLEVRVGIHTGEIERRGDDVAGIGVHIASRVQGCAQPGEVLVSRTVTDVVIGSGIQFTERGEHALKGVPGTWQLFAVG